MGLFFQIVFNTSIYNISQLKVLLRLLNLTWTMFNPYRYPMIRSSPHLFFRISDFWIDFILLYLNNNIYSLVLEKMICQVYRLDLDHLNSKRFFILICFFFHQKIIPVLDNLTLTIIKAVLMEEYISLTRESIRIGFLASDACITKVLCIRSI